MTRLLPTSRRARTWSLLTCVGVVLVVLSPAFGRADVVGTYRPLLPPDGLSTGCYPLPGGVELDFEYVLRRDGQVVNALGLRRNTVIHFDRIDAAEALTRAEERFRAAGVLDRVRLSARDFDGAAEDGVVRGEMVLDLPPVGRSSDSDACLDVYSTKRFTPDLPDRS